LTVSNEFQSQIDSASEPLLPLIPGTLLLDRYTVVNLVSHDETANVYHVVTPRPCPMCHVENEGSAAVCGFCGAELPEPNLLQLIEQRGTQAARTRTLSSFVIDGYCYTLMPNEKIPPPETAVPPLRFTYGVHTDPGLRRGALGDPNEDSMAAITFDAHAARGAAYGLFMIADGIGGAAAGEIVSQLALQTVAQEWVTRIVLPAWNEITLSDEMLRAELRAGIAAANARLLQYQSDHNLQAGTTLTAALVLNGHAYVINIGDSRTYLYRQGAFAPLTKDHSYVATLVANGALTPEEAYVHPQRNLILRSLGDVSAEPDIFPTERGALELQSGDQLLLCSDGLWEMVRDVEMQTVLEKSHDPQRACAELTNLANLAGGADNISVIVIHVM
jgi:serine/threonine protein phosphatase PrpC